MNNRDDDDNKTGMASRYQDDSGVFASLEGAEGEEGQHLRCKEI